MTKRVCQFWSFVGTSLGIIVLNERAKVQYATANVSGYLKRYFDDSDLAVQGLPLQLSDWLGIRENLPPLASTPAPQPLCLCHAGQRLVITSLPEDNGSRILLFSEQMHIFSVEALKQVGLTPRESEIMRWIAEGKGYGVIATIIDSKKRTVENHVRSIFTKFGVATQREAVLHVLDALGRQEFAPTPVDALTGRSFSCVNCPGLGLPGTTSCKRSGAQDCASL